MLIETKYSNSGYIKKMSNLAQFFTRLVNPTLKAYQKGKLLISKTKKYIFTIPFTVPYKMFSLQQKYCEAYHKKRETDLIRQTLITRIIYASDNYQPEHLK